MTTDTVLYIVIIVLALVIGLQQRLLLRHHKALLWFASHVRIDSKKLEKDPPPEDLQDILGHREE